MYCKECDHVFFDAPSPAVIVAVTEADRILLTRSVESALRKSSYWGLVAGHVKSGETAEETAIREVREEVGLEIFDLKILRTYVRKEGNLLMIGFTAKTKNISIKESKELEKATWFRLNEPLPLRPNSIAFQVVEQIFPRVRLIKLEEKTH